MPATASDVAAFVRAYASVIAEHKRELIMLDSAIGDADHGENMDRGLRAAVERLPGDDATPTDVLKAVAMALVSRVGGAAGPLYGTAFLRAATSVDGQDELSGDGILVALAAAEKGIIERGKTERGDKTMLDAWAPAVEAARESLSAGGGTAGMLAAAAAAAEQGMKDTVPLIARKGRASYLGPRSAGHQDPGATSAYLLFQTLADQAAEE